MLALCIIRVKARANSACSSSALTQSPPLYCGALVSTTFFKSANERGLAILKSGFLVHP